METPTDLITALIATALVVVVYAALTRNKSSGDGKQAGDGSQAPSTTTAQIQYESSERSSMPAELASARLVVSEQTFRRRGRRPFFAKIDQGFKTVDGRLVLVETKNHHQVTVSDLIQLSAQAIAIASEVGSKYGRIADYGFIRLQALNGPPAYHAYKLYPEHVLDQLVDRYHLLKEQRVSPLARPIQSRCARCVFRRQCQTARSSPARTSTH